MLWIDRTGAPWRNLPERYGPVGTVSSRFYRWHAAGVWLRILSALQAQVDARGEVDWNLHFVDATVIRAHQHAAGARRTGDAEGGENVEALGRSQGGLSTKLHLHAEGLGKLSGDIRGAGHKRHQNPSTRLPTLFRKPFSRQGTPAEAGNRVDGFQMSPADGSPKSPDRQADHGRADGRRAARAGRAGSAAGWWCGSPSRPGPSSAAAAPPGRRQGLQQPYNPQAPAPGGTSGR